MFPEKSTIQDKVNFLEKMFTINKSRVLLVFFFFSPRLKKILSVNFWLLFHEFLSFVGNSANPPVEMF